MSVPPEFADDRRPVLPLVVHLDEPLPTVCPGSGSEYRQVHCLVLLDGRPLGVVRLDLPSGGLSAPELAARLWARVSEDVVAQRQAAGLVVPTGLPTRGLAGGSGPTPVPGEAATVVIATRDRPVLLEQCIRSVLAGTVLPEFILVVDNASASRATAELVGRIAVADPRVRYVREDRPGLGRAHNAALPHLSTPVVAFTDDDVMVDRQWLERLVAAFQAGFAANVACVTGMIAPAELETVPQQWIEAYAGFGKGLTRAVFDLRDNRPDDPLFPYAAGRLGSGANMAFRTDYLLRAGGFDDALGAGTVALGGDDLAAFYDVIRSGHALVYEPAAIVRHRHHRTWAALHRQAYGYGVGLGAHLTRCLLSDPRAVLAFARVAPRALCRAQTIAFPAPVADLPPYPSSLARRHWAGLLAGPWRYLRSRRTVGTGAASTPPLPVERLQAATQEPDAA